MNPNGARPHADRSDDRTAIRLHRQSFLFHGAKGDLLRPSIGKALAPQVALSFDSSDEIHPRAVGSPTGGGARTLRPDRSSLRSAVERDEPARPPISLSSHLYD